MTTNTT